MPHTGITLSTPTGELAERQFGADEENEVHPIGQLTTGVLQRLAEIAEHDPGCTVTMARNWEFFPFALIEYPVGHPSHEAREYLFDVLIFTDDGQVGHGGVNQPLFFDTIAQYLVHMARWREVAAESRVAQYVVRIHREGNPTFPRFHAEVEDSTVHVIVEGWGSTEDAATIDALTGGSNR